MYLCQVIESDILNCFDISRFILQKQILKDYNDCVGPLHEKASSFQLAMYCF
jgi:hypothetical protein